MNINSFWIFIIILILTQSCGDKNLKMEVRLQKLQSKLNTQEDKLLLINLDGCPSCAVLYRDFAIQFLDSGAVVLVSRNSKKAKAFLDLSHPKVFYDKKNLSEQLKLSNDMPTVYYRNDDRSIDSLIVGF